MLEAENYDDVPEISQGFNIWILSTVIYVIYVRNIRDGMNMLQIEVGGKAEKKIAAELKEVKTKKQTKKSSCDDNFNDNKRSRQQSEDRERPGHDERTEEKRRLVLPPQSDGGNRFDLRGVIIEKNIKQIRNSVDSSSHSSKNSYIFNPRQPRPDPYWPEDQQILIGPIPGSVPYLTLERAVKAAGKIHRLYLQYNDRNKPNQHSSQVYRYAYAVFREREVAAKLLADSCIFIAGDYFAVARMEGQTWSQ